MTQWEAVDQSQPRRVGVPVSVILALAFGGGLLAAAVLVSNAGIERGLRGEATNELAWGPTLFRLLLGVHGIVLMIVGVLAARRRVTGIAAASLTQGNLNVAPRTAPRIWWMLAALSVLAFGLRLWALDSCLWFDEVVTVVDFVRPPLGHIVTAFPSQNQHMLFSVLAHGSVTAFGESVWAVRLPSVLFGVASLWALFFLGRRIVGRREALVACALMAVSYHHVWFSQNARGYMGLLFFATLATWLWLEALSRQSWRWHVAYAVALALGMWTHMTMVFVPLTHALLFAARVAGRLLNERTFGAVSRIARETWHPLAAWVLAGSLTLQLYALALPEFLRVGLHEVSLESEWTNPLWVVTESVRSLQIGFGAVAVVVCGVLVAATGWLSLARRNWLAACALILPPVLGAVTMLVLHHNLWPRFFFFSMGFGVLIAVHGALRLPELVLARVPRLRERPALCSAAGSTLAAFMILASLLALPRVYALPKQDFAGARDYVEQARRPEDGVVAVGLAGMAYQRYFAPHWQVAETAEELETIRRSHARVWLVYTIAVELKAYRPEIWKVVDKDFDIVKVFPGTLGGGEVNVCRERRGNDLARGEGLGSGGR